MDDYLHFVEAHSLYLFRGGVLSSRVREAWGLLRIVVLHYFRALTVEHDTFPFTQEACQRAEKAMLDFAKLMEEVSLHSSSCSPPANKVSMCITASWEAAKEFLKVLARKHCTAMHAMG